MPEDNNSQKSMDDSIEFMRFTRKPGEPIDYEQLEEALGRKIDPLEFVTNFEEEKYRDEDGTMHYILKAKTRELFEKYTEEVKNLKK